MKKIFLIGILLLFAGISAFSQSTFRRGIIVGANGDRIDSIKVVDDTIRFYGTAGASTGGQVTVFIDTTSLSNRIDAKLNTADTTNAFDPIWQRIISLETAEVLVDTSHIYIRLNNASDSILTLYNAGYLTSVDLSDINTTGTADNTTYLRGDGAWSTISAGSSTITDLGGTAWRIFYSNGSGEVTELALGADGTYLRSNGATSAPTFATPSGSGDMLAATYDTDADNKADTSNVAERTVGLSLGTGGLATVGNHSLTFTTLGNTGVIWPTSSNDSVAYRSWVRDFFDDLIANGTSIGDVAVLDADSTGGPGHYASWYDMTTGLNSKEDMLGNPSVNGYVLSSTTAGVRTWIENGSGGSMVYPSGSGIPIVSSGASWGTTITDNSTNWNSAYGWGNHASAGYEPGLGNPASDGYVLTSTAAGVRSWAASSGTVTIEDVSGVVGDSLDAIRAASVQGLTLGDSSLYVTPKALMDSITEASSNGVELSTLAYMHADTMTLYTWNIGIGAAGDTAAFRNFATHGYSYGSFFNAGSDTLVITRLLGKVNSGGSIAIQVSWHATDESGSATNLNTTPFAVTSSTTGDSDTSFDNAEIPPNVWVWLTTPTVTTQPTKLRVSLIGHKRNLSY